MTKEKSYVGENYITIKIPKDLANTIEDIIKNTDLGYRNRSEFIVDAVRRRIEKIKMLIKEE